MIHTTASIAALLVVALLFFLHIKLEVLRLNGQFKKMVILRVTHKIVAESSVIQQTKFQDVFLSVTVNSVYKYLMKLFSVHVLHLLSYHVCGFLLPQNGLQPLANQMLLLVIVVLHLRLQTQNYGQGDAEDSDYFAELRFFFDYHAFLQRQSQVCDYLRHTIVAGWLISILEFLYCSLPRPPENRCDFSSHVPRLHFCIH